ncbi:hypothetical protein NDU88_009951 [Pleurodeles waltl]|uniref:Uncharacterized protein n=1 Tax=Pleurodeles waltl TaxID=8319 RepID=A0AAV7PTI8_PLEWA|nr:hypothetical protein NDU88_009951 [Pleurodeles waltl]
MRRFRHHQREPSAMRSPGDPVPIKEETHQKRTENKKSDASAEETEGQNVDWRQANIEKEVTSYLESL